MRAGDCGADEGRGFGIISGDKSATEGLLFIALVDTCHGSSMIRWYYIQKV